MTDHEKEIRDARGAGPTPDLLRYEADAMYAAVQGEEYGDTFHALNWADKPHRVLYDAIKLMRGAADDLTSLREERDRLREGLKAAADQLVKVHDNAFRQAGGYGLVTGDGRGFSCFELTRCQEVASRARALIQETKP